jgi:LmbE family N-acetylglucosaminyl deacetylase
MNIILVIAPHPDDETLGCGGTLLKHKQNGDSINWLIATSISGLKADDSNIQDRKNLIDKVSDSYKFNTTYSLNFPTTSLDTIPKKEIINEFEKIFSELEPNIIYVPYRLDAHSDHEVVFDAAVACAKTFRSPSIKSIRCYQTISETEFGSRPEDPGFKPNLYVDISEVFEKKIDIARLYQEELGEHPFPRSIDSIKAQSLLNGSVSGCHYAESFLIVKEIQ